ncbi:hypothetical protein [Methanococcoides sp. NM1]|nr:hypothetical protein [Methanococcoides sp. NM1]
MDLEKYKQDLEDKCSSLIAVSRLTVSTSNVLKRFKKINEGQTFSKHKV